MLSGGLKLRFGTISLIGTLPFLLVGTTPVCMAQQPGPAPIYARTDVRDLLHQMKRHSDDFKHHLDHSLDNSTLNGTHQEDRLKHWADDLKDTLDHLQDDYSHGTLANMTDRLNNALAVAAGINRVMLYRPFGPETERDWTLLRSDLNALAVNRGLPPLQTFGPQTAQRVP